MITNDPEAPLGVDGFLYVSIETVNGPSPTQVFRAEFNCNALTAESSCINSTTQVLRSKNLTYIIAPNRLKSLTTASPRTSGWMPWTRIFFEMSLSLLDIG